MADSLYDIYEAHKEELGNVNQLLSFLNKTIQAFPYPDG